MEDTMETKFKGLLFKPAVLAEFFDTGEGKLEDAFSFVDIVTYHDIQKYLGCDHFTTMPAPKSKSHRGFVDDEGLINGTEYFTRFKFYNQPVAGNILYANCEMDGGSSDCTITPSDVLEDLVYCGKRDMVMYLEATYTQEELAND